MNSTSRALTGQAGKTIPAIASGLVRHWGKVNDSYTASPLVAEPGDGVVNGVLLEIEPKELYSFDQREVGYHRVALTHPQIDVQHQINPSAEIWVYVKEKPQSPCHQVPVLQTYIDTVLAGCLEVSEEFAHLFIQHTLNWHAPVLNDREAPEYRNYAGVSPADKKKIDQLLLSV